jgi:two-component system LytT family sensor kinase
MTANAARPRWIWIVAPWFGLGFFDAVQTVFMMHSEGMHHAWLRLFAVVVLSWLPWAIATPFVLGLWRRYPLRSVRPVRHWLAHAAALVVTGTACATAAAVLYAAFNPYALPVPESFSKNWIEQMSGALVSSVVLYTGLLVVAASIESRERLTFVQTETARVNELLSKARLEALRCQIEPHFLFNTLGGVSGLVREGRNDDAVQMIAGLGALFRRLLDDDARQHVPLADEMEFARAYLDLQKMRFADRLRLRFDVPREYDRAQVPSLILQPLVENAVKHGIAKRAAGGTIAITASRSDGMLSLCIQNDGPPLPAGYETALAGIGLSNVRARLRSLYGDACDLRLCNAGAGVEVLLSLPFVLLPAMHEG